MRSIRAGEMTGIRMIALAAVCFAACLTPRVSGQAQTPAPVTIDPPATSFGVLLPGEEKTASFEIVNNGAVAIRLTKINPSCPCITGRTKTDLIEPGGRLEVVLDITAGWEPHKVASKNIGLFFEGYDVATNSAAVFAVDRGVRTNVKRIELNRGLKGKVRLESKDGEAFSVLSVDGKAPRYPGGFDPAVHDPRMDYNVTYDFTGRGAEMPMHLIIETDHEDGEILALPIISDAMNAKRDSWQKGRLRSLRRSTVLGHVPVGRAVDFEFDMLCIIDDFSLDTTAQNHERVWVDILSKKRKSSGKWRVQARMTMMDESFRGVFDETIVLRVGGNLQTSFQIIGKVVDSGEEQEQAERHDG